MEIDRNSPEAAALRVLLKDRDWGHLEEAIAASREAGTGDPGVGGYLRDLHLPEVDRHRLLLAYGLWRGFGPAVQIQDLWGMEPGDAAQILAGLAFAVDRANPSTVLENALAIVKSEVGEDLSEPD